MIQIWLFWDTRPWCDKCIFMDQNLSKSVIKSHSAPNNFGPKRSSYTSIVPNNLGTKMSLILTWGDEWPFFCTPWGQNWECWLADHKSHWRWGRWGEKAEKQVRLPGNWCYGHFPTTSYVHCRIYSGTCCTSTFLPKCWTLAHSPCTGWLWNQGFSVTINLSWKDQWGIEEQGSNPFISKMEITSHTLNLNSIYFLLSGKNEAVQNHFLTFRKSEAVQKWSLTGCAVTCSGGGKTFLRRSLKLRKFFQNRANWFCQSLKRHFLF